MSIGILNNDSTEYNSTEYNSTEYDYSFLCTYQHIEDAEESDLCYKMQFLQAFGLNSEYDSAKIDRLTSILYQELQEIDSFKKLISGIREKMSKHMSVVGFLNGSQEDEITDADTFCFVFSYEYFYRFHREYALYKTGKNYDFDFIFII